METRLKALEYRARRRYRSLLKDLNLSEPAAGIDAALENRFVFNLKRYGFDAALAQGLFRVAPSAWRSMGMISADAVVIHPPAERLLKDIRQGLIRSAEKSALPHFWSEAWTPAKYHQAAKTLMDPANLSDLLEDIPTPWIILPRAFSLLQEADSRYFPVYLKWIDKETRLECLRIFFRLLIEFTGNYAVKFASGPAIPKVKALVTQGYTAMFYKTLRTPPEGFEDVQIFEPFLNWLKFSSAVDPAFAEKNSVKIMDAALARIFPGSVENTLNPALRDSQARFLIALRHGSLGITATAKFFWAGSFRDEMPWPEDRFPAGCLSALGSFFDLIRRRYPLETERTRHFIREFLDQLDTARAATLPSMVPPETPDLSLFQRRRHRILAMIGDLRRFLS